MTETAGAAAPAAIRRATAADDPAALRALRLEMLADTPIAYIERLADVERYPPGYWRDRLARYTDGRLRVLYIAEDAGRWVGQAGGYLDERGTAYLVSVYVTPAHRGTGLVERLSAAVADWARGRGCAEIRLEVAVANRRAVAAYERLGFQPTGRRQPHPLYPEVGMEIEMVRPL